jgi:tetratricopeptide (TPR) repeat protein
MAVMRKWFLLLGLMGAVGVALAGFRWYRAFNQPDYQLERGQEALRRGDRAKAQHVVWVLEADGHRDHAHLLRAQLLFHLAKPDLDQDRIGQAVPLLKRCQAELNLIREQGDLRIEAAALSGQCLLYMKEPAEAERALTFVLKHHPDHVDAHRGLAALYYDQGALAMAMDHLKEVVRLDSEDGRAHRFMGRIYKELEQIPLALTCYEKAMKSQLSEGLILEVRAEWADCLVKAKEFGPALALLQELPANGPLAAELPVLRAQCLVGLDRTEEARKFLDGALTRNPKSVPMLRLRAQLFLDAQDAKAAAGLLEQAVALDPHDYESRYLLGQVYQNLNRPEEAAKERQSAEQIKGLLTEFNHGSAEALNKPWDAALRRRLADLCIQLGRRDQADQWLQAAAACRPE